MTDKLRVLNHLQERGTITPGEAWSLYGCYRLSHQIYLLRKDGFKIKTDMVYGKDMHGESNSFALYRLEAEK